MSILRENTSENEYQSADKEWAMSMMKKWQEEDKRSESRTRSVRMSDDVDVFEADGQINITTLKDYDCENERPHVREKPGKVTKVNNVAVEPKYKLDECNTQ